MCTYSASDAPPPNCIVGDTRPRGNTVRSYGYSQAKLVSELPLPCRLACPAVAIPPGFSEMVHEVPLQVPPAAAHVGSQPTGPLEPLLLPPPSCPGRTTLPPPLPPKAKEPSSPPSSSRALLPPSSSAPKPDPLGLPHANATTVMKTAAVV